MTIQRTQIALWPRLDERFWLMRNFALRLVAYIGALEPPVRLSSLLESPPPALKDALFPLSQVPLPLELSGAEPPGRVAGLPAKGDEGLEEARYQLSRRILRDIARGQHARSMGLPALIGQDMEDCQDYFARVLLAPDFLVAEYRRRGNGLAAFAREFLIPNRIAFLRWMDPIFADQLD